MKRLESGDLHVSEIVAVFEAMDSILALAFKQRGVLEIAQSLDWRREDVREAARLLGITICEHPIRPELCPACGHILTADRHCEVCARRTRLDRLQRVNAEEHRREVERLERDINVVKSDTRHVRERLGTNPRKGAQEDE